MRIILLGPQGSGKGTQADRLSTVTGARHVATGDLVRAEIASETALGRQIKEFNDRGELVPDAIMLALVRPYITPGSWILDGFPRDRSQAEALDALLQELGVRLDRVISLVVPDDALVTRLLGRRQSKATNRVYNLTYAPPPADDPGPFVARADDTPEDILRRLQLYHQETEPLKQYYDQRGLLTEVNAAGSIDDVTQSILKALELPAIQ